MKYIDIVGRTGARRRNFFEEKKSRRKEERKAQGKGNVKSGNLDWEK